MTSYVDGVVGSIITRGTSDFAKLLILKQAYHCAWKAEKAGIAAKVVASVRSSNPPARFLKETEANCWLEVGDDVARAKAMQALKDAFRKENGRPTQRTSNIPPREDNSASVHPTLDHPYPKDNRA
ncbi:hypothetical protein ACHAXT_009526 [Thalassiosira profunda]